MAEERVFFDEGGIYISNSRIAMSGTTYSTANITSVSTRKTPVKAGCAIAVMALGGLGMVSLFSTLQSGPGLKVFGFLFWGMVIAVGFFWFQRLRPTYHVLLSSASGESEALGSKDKLLIDRVTAAINNAMIARG